MSAALQRVMVRMLHDPALVARVYAGERLRELDDGERAMLLRVDRRAWGVDPYRRARLLRALLEEFVVSGAVIGVAALDAFCSSPSFHRGIQLRRSMAEAFTEWLAPQVGELATLEGTIARARRYDGVPGLGLAPGVAVCAVGEGLLDRWLAAREALGPDPVASVVAGARTPRLVGHGKEWILVEARGERVGSVSEPLGRLLLALGGSGDRARARREARRLGADDPDELLDELLGDGLLADSPAARPG